MSKHTQGDWVITVHERGQIHIEHCNNDPGAISKIIARVTARKTWLNQALANARLMAAAPKLLRVLKDLQSAAYHKEDFYEAWVCASADAIAVIADVEGEP